MRERFGEYELLKLIATGGMAEIYLAELAGAEGFSRRLVVKRMLPQLAVRQDFVAMFLDEARLAANLVHPNIVQVFNLGEVNGAYFMAMELVDGPHLGALFAHSLRQRRPLPLELCAFSVARASDGLHYAHEQNDPLAGTPLNLVHRDISPQNILVSRHGDVKVTDFGVAKAETQSAKTRTGIIKGKVSYMSPEQCLGDNVDRQTDVFALGIVLYELLTRRRLYREKSDLLVMQRITTDDVAPPSTLNPAVDAELDAITVKALSREKATRYHTAGDLADALDVWLAKNGHVDCRAQLQRWLHAHGQHLRVGPTGEESISQPRWRATSSDEAFGLPSDDDDEATIAADETTATPALGSREDDDGSTLVVSAESLGLQLALDNTMPDGRPDASVPGRTIPSDSASTLIAPPPVSGLNEVEVPAVAYEEESTEDGGLAELEPEPLPLPLQTHSDGGGTFPAIAAVIALVSVVVVAGLAWLVLKPPSDPAPIEVVIRQDSGPALRVDPIKVDPKPLVVDPPVENPLNPATPKAKVIVNSIPSGVVILSGNDIAGTSPVEMMLDDGAEVELSAIFEGQAPIKQIVRGILGEVVEVTLIGKVPIVVRSKPSGATLFINGEGWGATPKERGVFADPEGPIEIELVLDGYEDYKVAHQATPGEALVVDAVLEKIKKKSVTRRTYYGTLQINSRPWAQVFIDGVSVGASPTKLRRVRAGKHNVRVQNAGFAKNLVVNVNPNQDVTVGFIFEKEGNEMKFKKHVVR